MENQSYFNYIILDERKDVAVIELGRHVLGGNDALNFTAKLNEVGNKNVRFVALDLINVEVMNSSGLGMLVSGLSTVRKYDIYMLLIHIPSKVRHLLEMTHLDKVFKMYESIEDAIENNA